MNAATIEKLAAIRASNERIEKAVANTVAEIAELRKEVSALERRLIARRITRRTT